MQRLLLLLPLLLLAAAEPAEPAEPTPGQMTEVLLQQTAELLVQQTAELQSKLTKMVNEANASSDPCAEVDMIAAGMEMLASKYGALSIAWERTGDIKQAMQAKGAANAIRAEERNLRRKCR